MIITTLLFLPLLIAILWAIDPKPFQRGTDMKRTRQTYAEAIIMAGTMHYSTRRPIEEVILATPRCDAWQCYEASAIGPVHGAYYCAAHAAKFGINQAE